MIQWKGNLYQERVVGFHVKGEELSRVLKKIDRAKSLTEDKKVWAEEIINYLNGIK